MEQSVSFIDEMLRKYAEVDENRPESISRALSLVVETIDVINSVMTPRTEDLHNSIAATIRVIGAQSASFISDNKAIQNHTCVSPPNTLAAPSLKLEKIKRERLRWINADRLLALISIVLTLFLWTYDKVSSAIADRQQAEIYQEIVEVLNDIRDGPQRFCYSVDCVPEFRDAITESN